LFVQPVSGIRCGLADLLCDCFVVLACGLDQYVVLAGLGCRNAFNCESDQLSSKLVIVHIIKKCGKGILRIKDPFLRVMKFVRDLVRGITEGLLHSGVPVGFHKVLEIPAVGRARVGNI
jgi:hypothetical protein